MEENLKIWNDAKRIVVKVGSSLVTNEGRGVDTEAIARWTAQIAKLQEMGKQVVWSTRDEPFLLQPHRS